MDKPKDFWEFLEKGSAEECTKLVELSKNKEHELVMLGQQVILQKATLSCLCRIGREFVSLQNGIREIATSIDDLKKRVKRLEVDDE